MKIDIKTVGGYIRVSTQEQSQKGLSLETQEEEIKSYCKRMGYKLYRVYIDKGITARKDLYKRNSFMDMMHDVETHKIDHIVVLRLDRFFRNVYDYHRMMNEYLIPNNCGWSAVKEEYNTTTTNGRLMINLRLSIAEQECDQDSDRIKDIFANRIREGYIVNGSQPYGLDVKDHRLVPGDKAYIVQDIFKEFLATGSARQTLVNMNAKHGIGFDYNRLLRVLHTTKYIGVFRDNDHYCEPIIDKDDFYRVQDELKRNARIKKNKRFYIFSKMLRCSHCGKSLCGSTAEHYADVRYYRCNNYWTNHKCDNPNHIREDDIEKYLVENVEELLKDYVITIKASEKTIVPNSNRSKIEKKIERLKELYVNGVIDLEELKLKKADLESQIIEDENPVKKDLTQVNALLNSNFTQIYYDLTPEERRTLWRSVIKEIVVDTDVKSIVFY